MHREIIHVDVVFKSVVTFEKQINEIQRNQRKIDRMFNKNTQNRGNLLIFSVNFLGVLNTRQSIVWVFPFFERKMRKTYFEMVDKHKIFTKENHLC